MDVPMSQYPIDAGPLCGIRSVFYPICRQPPPPAWTRRDPTSYLYIINVDDVSLDLIIAELLT